MAETDSEKNDPESREQPDVIKTREYTRTIRWLIVCILIGFCVWRLSGLIEKLTDKPPWLTFSLAILSAFVPSGGLAFYVIRSLRRGARERHSLITTEQDKRLAGRSSSGLTPDGNNPPEDNV